MPVIIFSPRPQFACIRDTIESLTSRGARSAPLAHIPYSTSASTRSGNLAATAAAIWPPCDAPNKQKRSTRTASATASAVATCPSNDRSTESLSERPHPGLS